MPLKSGKSREGGGGRGGHRKWKEVEKKDSVEPPEEHQILMNVYVINFLSVVSSSEMFTIALKWLHNVFIVGLYDTCWLVHNLSF